MNIDDGRIMLWRDLTDEERASGRWVKMTEGEHARAQRIEEHERRQRFADIIGPPLTDAEMEARIRERERMLRDT